MTDSDGAPTVAFVDLKVVRERDYPPLANAGSDIVLKVPNSEVILDGSRSTDDKPGLKYRWKNLSEKKLGLDIEVGEGGERREGKEDREKGISDKEKCPGFFLHTHTHTHTHTHREQTAYLSGCLN